MVLSGTDAQTVHTFARLFKTRFRKLISDRASDGRGHLTMAVRVRSTSCRDLMAITILFALSATSCGSPSSPDVMTESQILSDTTWSGTFGELGTVAGSGNSEVLNIGDGRQCAVVRKIGPGSMTVRVANDLERVTNLQGSIVLTACGEGALR